MFTGIVEEIGKTIQVQRSGAAIRVTIAASLISNDIALGDSVSVNGACLTLSSQAGNHLSFDAVPETVERTSLKYLIPGSPVNLERAMRVGDRIGGHFVQGHVDGIGVLQGLERKDNARLLTIQADVDLLKYMVPKGSVAVDGVSLTLDWISDSAFTVWIIPHTFDNTVFRYRKIGDKLNLENDLIGKYVARYAAGNSQSRLDTLKLAELGYLDDYDSENSIG